MYSVMTLQLQTVDSFQLLLLYPKVAPSSSNSGKKKTNLDLRRVLQLLQCITLSDEVDSRFAQDSLCLSYLFLFVDISKVLFDFSATFIPTVQD